VEQYRESQYDDDLTLAAEEYDDSFETSDIDLFAFTGEDDSPISRLKSLVLSLDWEISDTVLLQFNDEVLDLQEYWASDKINMVYLQALEKIGKYIYREKADAHPNSIKLLLSMYHNLERIVLSDELDEAERKQILVQDVRRFEKLKKLIAGPSLSEEVGGNESGGDMVEDVAEVMVEQQTVPELIELKALVLGIDWEITEQQLLDLRKEVEKLQQEYAGSRPRLVFLQGIGALATYIRKRKVDSHPDAFKILRSFFDGLEEIVQTPGISFDEQKKILIPEVKKFEEFKKIIAQEKSQPKKDPVPPAPEPEEVPAPAGIATTIAPAFADLPDDGARGFQEEAEAAALGLQQSEEVDERLSNFFIEEEKTESAELVPAQQSAEEKVAEAFSDAFFGEEKASENPGLNTDREMALRGVDVETEADDDSGEEALPAFGGEVAPALMDFDEVSAFSEQEAPVAAPSEPAPALGDFATTPVTEPDEGAADFSAPPTPADLDDTTEAEIDGRLTSFFDADESEDESVSAAPTFSSTPAKIALQGVDVEAEGDEEDQGELEPVDGPALGGEAQAQEFDLSPASEQAAEPATPVSEEITFDFEEPEQEPAEFVEQSSAEEVAELTPEVEEMPTDPAPAFADLDEREEFTGVKEDDASGNGADLEVATEIESQLDQLFSLGESDQDDLQAEKEEQLEIEAEEDGVQIASDQEMVVEEDIMPALPPDEPIVAEFDEEEVVFTLAEDEPEEEELPVEEVAVEEPDADYDSEPELVAVADIQEVEVQEPIAEFQQILDEPVVVEEPLADTTHEHELDLEEVFVAEDVEPQEILQDLGEAEEVEAPSAVVAPVTAIADDREDDSPVDADTPLPIDRFADLRGCVQSLDLQLDDAIIAGLNIELTKLQESAADKPVEKSYLQLISTVCQHIDMFRYDSDDRSNALLLAILDDLEKSSAVEPAVAQENVLALTGMVLKWQHEMLAEAAEARAKAESSLAESSGATFFAENEGVVAGFEVTEPVEAETGDVAAETPAGVMLSDKQLTDVVRREIDMLRETLKREIKELRKAVQSGN